MKSHNTVRVSSRGSFSSPVQRLQTLSMQEVAAVSKSVEDSGREALIELHESISEFEAAAEGQLDRLVGGALASPRAGAAVFEVDETGGASGARAPK